MLNNIWFMISKWLAGFLLIFAIFFKIKQSGKESVRNENLSKTIEGIKQRDKIQNHVNTADDIERRRLRDKWTKKS